MMSCDGVHIASESARQNSSDHVRFKDDDTAAEQEHGDQTTNTRTDVEEAPSPEYSRRSSSAKKSFKLTLPDILKYKYGLIKAGEEKGEGSSKNKPKKKLQTFAFDDEREKENKKLKEQEKYIQLLGHLERLKEQCYEEYMAALRVKVHKQHTELKQRSAKQQRCQTEKLEKERAASHTVTKRLPRHKLNHDDNFLQDVHHSRLHKAVTLQDRMVKDGTLKYTSDIDDFWATMKKQPSRVKPERIPDSSDVQETAQEKEEDKDASHQGSTDSWAVTQMYSHQNKLTEPRRGSGPSVIQQQSISRSLPKAQSARKPPNTVSLLDLPNVCLFKIDLSQKPPDPEEIRQKQVLKSREHSRKKFMRKLHKMYQLAQANEVAANRILKNTHAEDLEFLFQGPLLSDVIETSQFIPVRRAIEGPESQCESLTLVPHPMDDVRSLPSPEHSQPAIEAAEQQDMSRALVPVSVEERSSERPLPLTMTALTENATIIEAKCLSTNWVNYMKKEKPAYTAPT